MEPRTMDTGNFACHHDSCPGIDDHALILSAVESFRQATVGCRLYKGSQEMSSKLLNPPCRNDAVVCQLITACLVDMKDTLEELLPHLTYTRAAISTTANMCRKLASDISVSVMEAVPLLTDLLNHHDVKVVEHASVCLTRIAEAFSTSQEKLDKLCNYGLVAQAASLLSVSKSNGLESVIIRLLSICASGSPLAAKTLILHGISGILKDILSGSVLAAGTTVPPTLTRPADQMYEIVNLADRLLPALPSGTITLPGSSIRRPSSRKQGESGSIDIEVSGQEKLLRDQPELLQQFGIDILPAMTQVYGSSVNGPIRHKCLSIIAKLMYFSSAEMMEYLLGTKNISSFLVGILSLKDPQVLTCAIQIAKILAEKLPQTFSEMFVKKRVFDAIESLVCQEKQVCLSTQSVWRPSARSKSLAAADCATRHDTQEGSRNSSKGKGKAAFKSPSDEPKGPHARKVASNKDAKVKPSHDRSCSQIYINHGNSIVPLNVQMDKPSSYMMKDYKKTLNGNCLDFYFAYNSKVINPHRMLCSYGILNGSTITVNNRIRGGNPGPSFEQYVADHKHEFKNIEMLPDGNLSLKLTVAGCRFLWTLVSCFTDTWSKRKSWDGQYRWDENFKIVDGIVRIAKRATGGIQSSSMENDIKPLVEKVDAIFSSDDYRLKDRKPPYLSHLIKHLESMKSTVLSDVDELILASHLSAMECHERLMLGIALRRRYKGSGKTEKQKWKAAIEKARTGLLFDPDILKIPVFEDISAKATKRGEPYEGKNDIYFRLTRDYGVHSVEHRWMDNPTGNKSDAQIEKFPDNDAVELMIPMHLHDFLARLVVELIYAKIDINKELSSAVVRCSRCGIMKLAPPAVSVTVDGNYVPTWMRKLSPAQISKLKQKGSRTYNVASPQTSGTPKADQLNVRHNINTPQTAGTLSRKQLNASDTGKAPQTASTSSRKQLNASDTRKAVGVTIPGAPNIVSPVTHLESTQVTQMSNLNKPNVWKTEGAALRDLFPETASNAAANQQTSGSAKTSGTGKRSGTGKPSGTGKTS